MHEVSLASNLFGVGLKKKMMCALPLESPWAITFGSRLAQPISCRGENGVHGGDLMMQYVCVALMSFRTRL